MKAEAADEIQTSGSRPAGRSLPASTLPIILLLLIVAAKLFLVANQEIVAEPYDALSYVRQADQLDVHFGWGSTGYALWLGSTKALAVPQRLAIELLWLASACFLSFSICPGKQKRWVALPVFLAAAVAPQTYYLFDRALTDGFFVCLSAVALGFAVRVFGRDNFYARIPSLAGFGFLLGVMAITRNEGVLLAAFLVVWSLFVGFYDWRSLHQPLKRSLLGAFGALAVGGLFAVLLPGGLILHNGWRYGVFTPNFAEMPSHMRLLKTLASIDTGETNPRFIPISRKAREMAYAQSPTLARFRSEVENPENLHQQVSQQTIGMPGEIGGGWIWHVFNAAAESLGITTLDALDSTYRQATLEIEEGFKSGKYRRAFVPHPFLGKDLSMWMPHLGSGLRHALSCVLTPNGPMNDVGLSPADKSVFDRVCMRRISLVGSTTLIQGWVFSKNPAQPITGISADASPSEKAVASVFNPRADVQKAYTTEGFIPPSDSGFSILTESKNRTAKLSLALFSGSELVAKTDECDAGKILRLPGTRGEIVLGIDTLASSGIQKSGSLLERFKMLLWRTASSGRAWLFGFALGAVSFLVLKFPGESKTGCHWIAAAGTLAAWALSRFAFYSLISAAAWEAEPRYLQNTAVFGILATIVLLTGATVVVGSATVEYFRRKRLLLPTSENPDCASR